MPPAALKSNLATTLRVLFFYICSRLTASRITFCRTRSTLACVIAKRVSSLTKAERQRHGVGAHILCACAKHTENDRRRYFMPPAALYRCSAVFHATCGTQKQPCDNATRFVFLYMPALDCKQSRGIGARRYFMPPTALKNNLATTLRVLFFYICSLLTASSRAAYIKKTTLRFSQGCIFVWCRRSDSNRHG